MATATIKEPEVFTEIDPDSAEPIAFVDNELFYKVTMQLGAQCSWREYHGTRNREVVAGANGDLHHTHKWKIHAQAGPFTGRIVNGLISHQNEWLKKYRKREGWQGHIDRALLILDIQETRELPREVSRSSHAGMVPVGTVQDLVKAEVARILGNEKE
jgi:hypothetical protein